MNENGSNSLAAARKAQLEGWYQALCNALKNNGVTSLPMLFANNVSELRLLNKKAQALLRAKNAGASEKTGLGYGHAILLAEAVRGAFSEGHVLVTRQTDKDLLLKCVNENTAVHCYWQQKDFANACALSVYLKGTATLT